MADRRQASTQQTDKHVMAAGYIEAGRLVSMAIMIKKGQK